MISKDCKYIIDILSKVFKHYEIITEKSIGKYFIDIYIPKLKLGIEYDGKQHFVSNNYFHPKIFDFSDQKSRDKLKERFCDEAGIILVRFNYKDKLSESLIVDRILKYLDFEVYDKKVEFNEFYNNKKKKKLDKLNKYSWVKKIKEKFNK